VLQRQGAYPPPPGAPETPGLEIAGEVAALGEGARRYEVGDRVCALVPGGGYAEYAVVHEDNALPVPPGLSFTEAAAIPETFFTVWTNVFDRGRLKEGETLLVHGGSSGIGTTAIMLGKAFGAVVAVTAGTEEKCSACRALGADLAINYRTADFAAVLAERGIRPDVILDMVGGEYVAKNLKVAAMHRDDRLPEGFTLRGGLDAHHAEAPDLHRLDPEAPQRRRKGRDRPGAGKAGLAPVRGGAVEAHHLPHIPPCGGRRRPCPDGIERAYRQDRAAHVSVAGLSIASCAGACAALYEPIPTKLSLRQGT